MSRVIERARAEGRTKLFESEAFDLLRQYSIPVPEYGVASDEKEAVDIAERIGYPVAVKVLSRMIVHKTDVGGVVLGVADKDRLIEACAKIRANVRAKAPYADIEGCLIQKMVPQGTELIVGAVYDDIFGHVLVFGLGGILTELYRDVSMRIVPVEEEDAWDMIREVRAYKLLTGYRGTAPRDLPAIVDIIVKFSKLLSENPEIKEADLNPVIALEEGKGAYVVDARFLLGGPD
ncbi:acetate--CoA ligase family protein [Thermoproteus tenax]|uniref:Acetyl-CoA synthetase n=1 Tax=Thermoproteus tenax (strain ATCC 35583 / DSM 2078 / JCM 9277 / NBRC 100435 / Kra 1) TaxID=768679 RepID=G4RM34_THETK|nr:acetate--CoA ligase family protein [Thermoproteus tenax]CCC82629.1 acetyl-CoA synthetase [Thermoproteus tenax Kra 1]